MAYQLPDLPYAFDALEPHIDAKTMEIHHTKHHQTYITNVNNALKDNPALLGDVVLCPNPSYPIHAFGFLMAEGVIRSVPCDDPFV